MTSRNVKDFNAEDRIDLKLLEHSTYYLAGEIGEDNISDAIKWLLYENFSSKEVKVLTLYVNSTGGDLYQAFALIDVMTNSHHVIRTIGVGAVMSAAFLIFASGDKGERYAAKNASFMCHQYTDGLEGKHHDLKASMKEGEYCNQKMVDILKESTGLAPSIIKKKLLPASDVYLTATELVDLHVADHII
jgi:ATP-dependent Clp protease protease subunit